MRMSGSGKTSNFRISLKSHDSGQLIRSAEEVMRVLKESGIAAVSVPMPNKTNMFTLNRAPSVQKGCQDRCAIVRRKIVVIVPNCGINIKPSLDKVKCLPGVSVEIIQESCKR